jgi:hypothetical protein
MSAGRRQAAVDGKRRRWGGSASRKARAVWAPRVAAGVPCCRCRKPVLPRPWLPHDGWEPDHYPVSRWQGGTQTWPSHSPECNQSEGGKDGARIARARRAERATTTQPGKTTTERARGIRGV